jgi:hypothetical protein
MKMRRFVYVTVLALLVGACGGGDPGVGDNSTTTTTSGGVEGPVLVDSTEILYLESFPVQVRLVVRGSLPTPCHRPQWSVEDDGTAIEVTLWSVIALGQSCAQVLEPFEVSIALGSFETADLDVLLNGDEIGRVEIGAEATGPVVSLVGAGWSFGMCLGLCNADLVIDGEELVLTARDREKAEPLYENRGSLTTEGLERVGAAIDLLSGVSLDPIYGCPDCADGGAFYLEMIQDGASTRHAMEFGRPPEVLAELHGLAMGVIEAIERCSSDALVTVDDECTPWEGF